MSKLTIVIPVFNEEKIITQLLLALKSQTNLNFNLVFVDNNSTDDSVEIIKRELSQSDLEYQIIVEQEKGTGFASDTGFRFAIEQFNPSIIARTDADCIPKLNWVEEIHRSFEDIKLEFLVGKILPKKEPGVTIVDMVITKLMVKVAWIAGKIRRRGKEFKYPFILVAGNNLVIKPQIYIQAGGFPRTSIDDVNEDTVLAENVRKITMEAKYNPNMIVYNSLRRYKIYGPIKTLLWYKDRSWKPADTSKIDIR